MGEERLPKLPKEAGVYVLSVYEADGADPASREHDVYYKRFRRVVEEEFNVSSPTRCLLSGVPIEGSFRIIEEPSNRILRLSEYVLKKIKLL